MWDDRELLYFGTIFLRGSRNLDAPQAFLLAMKCLHEVDSYLDGTASLQSAEQIAEDGRELLRKVLRQTNGNMAEAARILGIADWQFRYKLRKAGIRAADFRGKRNAAVA